jgi:hypothetical protein
MQIQPRVSEINVPLIVLGRFLRLVLGCASQNSAQGSFKTPPPRLTSQSAACFAEFDQFFPWSLDSRAFHSPAIFPVTGSHYCNERNRTTISTAQHHSRSFPHQLIKRNVRAGATCLACPHGRSTRPKWGGDQPNHRRPSWHCWRLQKEEERRRIRKQSWDGRRG